MQDKIDELISKATISEDTYPPGCNGYPQTSMYFDKRKFAELIIKECVELMKESQAECKESGYWYYDSTEYYERCRAQADAFESAAYSIEYHFGVKS
jgi:hypothetical protein